MKLFCMLFTAACAVRVVVMLMPLSVARLRLMDVDDFIFVPGIAAALDGTMDDIVAYVVKADGAVHEIHLYIADMTPEERAIVKAGCLINFNRNR